MMMKKCHLSILISACCMQSVSKSTISSSKSILLIGDGPLSNYTILSCHLLLDTPTQNLYYNTVMITKVLFGTSACRCVPKHSSNTENQWRQSWTMLMCDVVLLRRRIRTERDAGSDKRLSVQDQFISVPVKFDSFWKGRTDAPK